MAGVTGTARASRGALVAVRGAGPPVGVVVFQYNPDEMTRRLQARSAGGDDVRGGAQSEAMRLAGPPVETISMAVELDSTANSAAADPTVALGVYPQLSALEMMLYPSSTTVIANSALALLGTIELVPSEAPLVLLVWGPGRVLPVRLGGFTITEQAYDADLTPLRARADLELRVLSYQDLPISHPGHHLFLAHQVAKEALAGAATGSVPLHLGLR